MRAFLAIQLPEPTRRSISAVQKRIEAKAPGFYRWTPQDQLHITLYFLGELEEEQAEKVAAAVASVKAEPFEIATEGLVSLPDLRNPRILATSIVGEVEKLKRFQQRLSDTVLPLAAFKENRAFFPHVTFARINKHKPGNAKAVKTALASCQAPRTEPFAVVTFDLVESVLTSKGPEYEALRTYPLS